MLGRIEERRAALLQSDDPITYLEVGAYGSSHPESLTEYVKTKTVGEICRISKSPRWAPLLFRIIRECKPKRCLELGAAVGISGAYQAAALMLNRRGDLTIIEGAEPFAAIANETLAVLDLADCADIVVGTFDERLPQVLSDRGPFDYIFLDGQHTYDATIRFFDVFKSGITDPALIVFDDIDWSQAGMPDAWEEISGDEDVILAIHLGPMGCCIVGSGPEVSFPSMNMIAGSGRL